MRSTVLTILVLLGAWLGVPASAQEEADTRTEQAEAPEPGADDEADDFIPSEEVAADTAVAFPTDI